ncbi:hypothetical protein [Flavobacterium sp. HNIBRBA15423]|uniref:hypothetical protein n=1 Tax=Flavobacterium sp. HNIBRBA15423 TaxID=3458683 RepID=UPI004043B4C6
MKKAIFTIFILISKLLFGQQYDSLEIEKNKIDKNNTIYSLGKEFVFNIEIIKDNKNLSLKKNDINTFELTDNIDSLKISEIHLTVIKPKLFQRTNRNQTEAYYSYEPNSKFISSTGIVENKNNVWIHPARDGFFKSLETCPFPYLILNKPIGYKWTDSMKIGNYWSNKMWGEWEGQLLLKYEYEIVGKEIVDTKMGKIDCIVIEAIANSSIGKSKLRAYFSDKYGFIKLNYILFNRIEIKLNLEKVINGPIFRSEKDFLKNRYK